MKCPVCEAWSIVKQTKKSPVFGYVRRRECANEHRFTTQEIVVPEEAIKERQKEALIDNINRGREKKLAFHKSGWKNFRKDT
jgi:transcriptional regulator NrdR family protein